MFPLGLIQAPPFGDGLRWVAGTLTRLAVVQASTASTAGTASQPLDRSQPQAASIQPHTTWHYRLWYRASTAAQVPAAQAPGGGGGGFDLSDALEVKSCE